MTWKSFHSRGETLRTVIETAEQRRDGVLPMDVEGVLETFGDEQELLAALLIRWHTRLAGRIERELVNQPMDLTGAVIAAWQGTVDDNAGLRAIIDQCAAAPRDDEMARMIDASSAKVWELLVVMAGRSSLPVDAAGLRIGAEIEGLARATHVPVAVEAPAAPSLLGRLRAALAA